MVLLASLSTIWGAVGLAFEEVFKLSILILLISTYKFIKVKFDDVLSAFFYVIFLTVLLYPFLQHSGRFSSIFNHPNNLAYTIVLLSAYFLSKGDFKWVRLFIATTLILLSGSSGGVIAIFLVYATYFYKNSKFQMLYFVLLIAFSIVIINFAQELPVFSSIYEKISALDVYTVVDKSEVLSFGNSSSFVWRITYWLALLNEYSYMDMFHKAVGLGVGAMSYGNYAYDWMVTDPHNDYVRILMERGWFFGAVYLVGFYYLIKNSGLGLYSIPAIFLPMSIGNLLSNSCLLLILVILIIRSKYEKL